MCHFVLKYIDKNSNKFIKLPYKAKGWLNSGLYKIKSENNLMLIAANAVVANAIMNTDATLTKR
mgnify:CR=1 FL=1